MPHGFQWSPEDYRNAERAAQIQAQAILEAQRKEQERLEREARRNARHNPVSTSASAIQQVRQPVPYSLVGKLKARKANHEFISRMRADNALKATFGSEEYIHNRYGNLTWVTKIKELRTQKGYTEEEAIQEIVATYTEESWKQFEIPLVEQYMGHRD